jgi:hypothetical protein
MTPATKLVGGTLYTVESRFLSQAKKRLIATFTNLKFDLSNCNQRTSHFSNRNKNRHFCFSDSLCVSVANPRTNTTPRPSNPSRPVLQWMIRTRYRLEAAAGAAASKDLGVGKRETE